MQNMVAFLFETIPLNFCARHPFYSCFFRPVVSKWVVELCCGGFMTIKSQISTHNGAHHYWNFTRM
jgi:hypothetical protein